jgi:hypothetical protein
LPWLVLWLGVATAEPSTVALRNPTVIHRTTTEDHEVSRLWRRWTKVQ